MYYYDLMLDFWRNVKDKLEYEMITQKDLAEKIKISYNTLQSWITKDRLPDAEQAVKIAEYLNTTVEYLVTGNQKKESKNTRVIMLLNQAYNIPVCLQV